MKKSIILVFRSVFCLFGYIKNVLTSYLDEKKGVVDLYSPLN